MANPWFRFKQFTVHHDRCAMKVTTDACLFGAWVASKMQQHGAIKNVLDIGTGTGLLSLILAQPFLNIQIDAIELEENAAQQALENVHQSPFANRIRVIHQDILCFEPDRKYDLVICNPPFHEQQLASPDSNKNKAHHDASLTLKDLAIRCRDLLSPLGSIAVLLPYYRKEEALQLFGEHGFSAAAICDVKQSHSHGFFRTMLLLSHDEKATSEMECIIIKNADQQYSPEFVTLLKDYYLIF
jgi:tRNA1Val (adenine37-N6)-methyltransferase